MAENVTLYLYTTVGCHLCEQAEALTVPLLENTRFRLALTEIADDDMLMEKYGIRIPVLKREDSEDELGWPFDKIILSDFLK